MFLLNKESLTIKTYAFKVALRGVSPMIWRRIRIAGNTSLASLHSIIRIVQDYDLDPLHQFHIYGKDYEIFRNQCVDRYNNPSPVVIDDFKFDAGDRFTYTSFVEVEIGFIKNHLHDIRIESIEAYSNRKKVPFCMSGSGMPGTKKHDYTIKMLDVLQIIFDKDDTTTTVGEVRRQIEALDTLRLNRKKANHKLAELYL